MTLLEQLPASASVYGAIRKLGGSERTVGYYYALVYCYAEKDGVSDSKPYETATVRAIS